MCDNLEKVIPISDLITKEFIQFHTKDKVLAVSIKDGTNPGENFMSVLYSVEVQVENKGDKGESEPRHHWLLKCYPSHPSRQKHLNKKNLFFQEVSFYNGITKDLIQFQSELVGLPRESIISLSLPPFLGGKAVDYHSKDFSNEEKIYSPLDNYILMTDLRSLGYRMADSKIGLDGDHMKLAFSELATLHALSWAYENKAGQSLVKKYPFLRKPINPGSSNMWLQILAENAKTAMKAIDSLLGDGSDLSKAIHKFSTEAEVIIQYFSSQDESLEALLGDKLRSKEQFSCGTEGEWQPWRVLCHSDCWINNLLFQYDSITGKPCRAVLLDFPLVKMGCPTLDLSCLVYTSTRREFRRKYLLPCLQLYHDRFIAICHNLNTTTLPPGFNMDALRMKFHVSKLIGFLIALISLPLNLIEAEDRELANLETKDESSTLEEMLHGASAAGRKGSLYTEWILELVEDLYQEGVI